VIEKFGRIDILHNNVGSGRMGGPLELSEAEWHKAINVNLTSVKLHYRSVSPLMAVLPAGRVDLLTRGH
jgi:NAD(P)-dependent dehydrogenase (short-subunit alcohol dehydrogenase family)